MSDRMKTWLLGILAAVCLSSGAAAINMWADVRDWKTYKEEMKAERMATLEMQVKADKELFDTRLDALNTRFGELAQRVNQR